MHHAVFAGGQRGVELAADSDMTLGDVIIHDMCSNDDARGLGILDRASTALQRVTVHDVAGRDGVDILVPGNRAARFASSAYGVQLSGEATLDAREVTIHDIRGGSAGGFLPDFDRRAGGAGLAPGGHAVGLGCARCTVRAVDLSVQRITAGDGGVGQPGADAEGFFRDGSDGARGSRGGAAYGVDVQDGQLELDRVDIRHIRGGTGGDGGFGGDGLDALSGDDGHLGGDGGTGGTGGEMVALRVHLTEEPRVHNAVIHDVVGGRSGTGGRGGSGGRGGVDRGPVPAGIGGVGGAGGDTPEPGFMAAVGGASRAIDLQHVTVYGAVVPEPAPGGPGGSGGPGGTNADGSVAADGPDGAVGGTTDFEVRLVILVNDALARGLLLVGGPAPVTVYGIFDNDAFEPNVIEESLVWALDDDLAPYPTVEARDPLLRDPEIGDLRLSEGSPAIDGAPSSDVEIDVDGNPRTPPADIGAYEFVAP